VISYRNLEGLGRLQ